MHLRSRNRRTAVAALLLAVLAACSPTDDSTDSATDATTDPSSAPTSDPASDSTTTAADECAKDKLPLYEADTLTIATDDPAFPPWFVDFDPTNGKGFESAVAYAVASEMGFSGDEVSWITVPFNASYQPGPKKFDFDINQISITAKRAESVTFSDSYYSAAQAVITLKDTSPFAFATTLADFAAAKLGAQVGTTSLDAITSEIAPSQPPAVFDNTNDAKQALLNGSVDAIVTDLPTAFYITAVEIPEGTLVGQFQPTSGETEQFGLLLEKDNELVDCVNQALTSLSEDGTLEKIEQRWLSNVVDVPELG